MLIPFRRERARTLRAFALAATPATAAPQGTTRRCADNRVHHSRRDLDRGCSGVRGRGGWKPESKYPAEQEKRHHWRALLP